MVEKPRLCICNAILATGNLHRLGEFVSPLGSPLGERYTEKLVDMSTRHALEALDNVAEACEVDVDSIKADVNLANASWKNRKDAEAYDHVLEGASKFEMLFCKTPVDEG